MTHDELRLLAPWFCEDERYLNGAVIDWSAVCYKTAYYLKVLRELLDSPIQLIRGAHPNRLEAIDAVALDVPLEQVYMALTRLPGVSWGVYAGGSFHLDTRVYDVVPARWMAIHNNENERRMLIERGLRGLITYEADGWLYLSYNHERAWDGLQLVFDLSRHRAEEAA